MEPLATDFHGALRHDGRLLALNGRVQTWTRLSHGIAWTLETPKGSFRLVIPGARPSQLPEGSMVKATGVCSVEAADWESLVVRQQPTGFTLLARQPEDVAVLRRAPFWTGRNVALGLGLLGAAGGTLQGFLWIRARRRIRELSRNRDEAQSLFRAILAERTRMAREIHDTLAQGFTAISAQLEVLYQPAGHFAAPLRKHLELAREQVRSSLEESRRSVWNLRSQSLEEHGFAKTLERLGTQLVGGGQTAFHFTQSGAARELSPAIENNVLRIGQEALTKAVRHGCPHRITCLLAFEADTLRLEIADDGAGFEPGLTQSSMKGGFGLSGMQERAREIHGNLVVESQPGAGSRITLTLPLSHV